MKNPFRRKYIHVAIVTETGPNPGREVVTLCGLTRKRQDKQVGGKIVRMCGTCLELQLKEYPADELNDFLSRMHDGGHALNDIIDAYERLAPLLNDLTEVFNRDGAAARTYKQSRD